MMEIGTKVRLTTGGGDWKREQMFFPELVVVVEDKPSPVKTVTDG